MRTTVKKIALVTLLLALAFSLSGCFKSNETMVKETINTFFTGLKNENKQQVVNTLDITLPGYQYYPPMLEAYFDSNETISITINFSTVSIVGDIATVTCFVMEQFIWDGESGISQDAFEFILVKRSGKWKISSESYLSDIYFD